MRFKKLIFRATRGKAFTSFAEYRVAPEDKMRNVYDYDNKIVYLVMFEDGGHIRDRVTKICSSFLDTV